MNQIWSEVDRMERKSAMDQFPAMRTGFNPLTEPEPGVDKDFLRMVVALMSILCEEAVKSAARFSACCGRRLITGKDTLIALKYESHKFWDKQIDERFIQRLEEEKTHTYETDEESEDEEGEEEGEEADANEDQEEEEEEEYHTDVKVEHDRCFYDEVMRISNEWDAWSPDDPVKRLLKNAIEATSERYA